MEPGPQAGKAGAAASRAALPSPRVALAPGRPWGCGCWGCPGSVSQPQEDIRVIVTHRSWLRRKGWGCATIFTARPPAGDELPDFLPLVSRAELVSFAQSTWQRVWLCWGTGRVSLRSRQEGRSVLGLNEDTLSPDSTGRGTTY